MWRRTMLAPNAKLRREVALQATAQPNLTPPQPGRPKRMGWRASAPAIHTITTTGDHQCPPRMVARLNMTFSLHRGCPMVW
jgi:hypothetical protein